MVLQYVYRIVKGRLKTDLDLYTRVECFGEETSWVCVLNYYRGEGPLKTTQDLFTQAEYFGEEGAKLFKAVREFSAQVCQQQQDCLKKMK